MLIAYALTLLACMVLYSTCKHQLLINKPLATQLWRKIGWGLNVAALTLATYTSHFNNALLAWLALNMLVFGLMPFVLLVVKPQLRKMRHE